jgi:thiosulfate/3-mercaptopyruvate sulfurtransferase
MPNDKRTGIGAFQKKGHIPGAIFFDIDKIAKSNTSLPHMLPSKNKFQTLMAALGISHRDKIVIYDRDEILSAPRVWWTFRCFGKNDTAILDGGFNQWIKEKKPIEYFKRKYPKKIFSVKENRKLVSNFKEVQMNLSNRKIQILDARSKERFLGKIKEPRKDLKSGHMPNSTNIPYSSLINNKKRTMKNKKTIRKIFKQSGVQFSNKIITSCGSGITACVLAFALYTIGKKDVSVYDGSWAEWGLKKDAPVIK